MNKTIAIAGIIGAFVFGILTANPVVEGVSGWKFAYSKNSLIPIGKTDRIILIT